IEACANLGVARSGLSRRVRAHYGGPLRGRRLLPRRRQDPQVLTLKILAVECDRLAGQGQIQKPGSFVIAFTCFGHRKVDAGQFLRNADGRADFETPATQLVEHTDFLGDPGRAVERSNNSYDPQTKGRRSLRHSDDQEIGRWAERAAEVVLAEKDALEAERLVARP